MISIHNDYSPINPSALPSERVLNKWKVDSDAPAVQTLWIDEDGVTNSIQGTRFVISATEPEDTSVLWINPLDNTRGNIASYDTNSSSWNNEVVITGNNYTISETEPNTTTLWIDTSVDNNIVINYTLPARKTINIYGVWDGSEYAVDSIYWVPSTYVSISNPATTMTGLGEDTRALYTPENIDAVVDDDANVVFKGFAYKETVEQYLQNTYFDNNGMSEYYDYVAEAWNEPDLKDFFTDENGELDFSTERYDGSMGAFPFELLFECPCDAVMDEYGTLTFRAAVDLSTPQDVFVIYERKSFTYTFLNPNGTVYASELVAYGESPEDPSIQQGAPPLPPAARVRYRMVEDSSSSDVVYSAVEDPPESDDDVGESGEYYLFTNYSPVQTASQRWKEANSQSDEPVSLLNYIAGTPNQATSFRMRVDATIPLVFVIDGVPEIADADGVGYPDSYLAGSGVKQSTGNTLSRYANFTPQTVSKDAQYSAPLPTVQNASGITIKDNSIGWFYDAPCYSNRAASARYISTIGIETPLFVYTKLEDIYCISFAGIDGSYIFTIGDNIQTSRPTYTYRDGVVAYRSKSVQDGCVYATKGSVMTTAGLFYGKDNTYSMSVASAWEDAGGNTITSFTLNGNIELTPTVASYNKPKLRVRVQNISSSFNDNSTGESGDEYGYVDVDISAMNVAGEDPYYVSSDVTDSGYNYKEITAIGSSFETITIPHVFNIGNGNLKIRNVNTTASATSPLITVGNDGTEIPGSISVLAGNLSYIIPKISYSAEFYSIDKSELLSVSSGYAGFRPFYITNPPLWVYDKYLTGWVDDEGNFYSIQTYAWLPPTEPIYLGSKDTEYTAVYEEAEESN